MLWQTVYYEALYVCVQVLRTRHDTPAILISKEFTNFSCGQFIHNFFETNPGFCICFPTFQHQYIPITTNVSNQLHSQQLTYNTVMQPVCCISKSVLKNFQLKLSIDNQFCFMHFLSTNQNLVICYKQIINLLNDIKTAFTVLLSEHTRMEVYLVVSIK